MIFRFSAPAFGALFTLFSFNLSAQGFGVLVDSATAKVGEVVCLPVRAKGFVDIISLQYSLTWNPQVLTFDHTQNYNLPGWMPSDFGGNTPGLLLVGWADVDGLPRSRPDGTSLYEVCFKVVGPLGSNTLVSPGSEGFPPGSGGAEAYNSVLENIWNPNLSVPGLIDVTLPASTSDAGKSGNSGFQLYPNPTAAASQVILQSSKSGTAMLSVTDALGRSVFEQKVSVKAGENKFEIPATAIHAKGMYQVSLQTAEGVSTQMLSVQ
jgi:hypothetical protein